MGKMRCLFICNTPFQTLNALNMQWHEKRAEHEADIYILNEFKNATSIYTEIKKSGLFSSVYLLPPMRNSQNTLIRSMELIWCYLHPDFTVRQQLENSVDRFPADCYDVIIASVPVVFIASLCKLNPNAEFYMFDDGTGSYYGNIASGGWKYKIFAKIFHYKNCVTTPKKLYVNNVKMCKSKASAQIEQLPHWDRDFLHFACKVFSIEQQKNILQQRVIFLSRPNNGIDITHSFNVFMEYLNSIPEDVLIRLHPREETREIPEKISIDDGNIMWELLISITDMDNKILIGYYSTAQMTPKMLFDQEPWLIFLYKIDEGLFDEESKKSYDITVEDLRENYRNKDKIFIPDSMEAFKAQLNSIITRINENSIG